MQSPKRQPRASHSEFLLRMPARASVVCLALLTILPPLASCSTLEDKIGTWLVQPVDRTALSESAPSAGPAMQQQDAAPAKETADPSTEEPRDPARSDIGFVSVAPSERNVGAEPNDAADDWAVQLVVHLSELVANGVMVQLYMNNASSEKPKLPPALVHVVQIGSHRELGSAIRHLEAAAAGAGALLSAHRSSILITELAGRGRFYRVHFGPLTSKQAARSLCRALQDQGHDCLVQEQIVVAGPPPAPERRIAAESKAASAVNLASADQSALDFGMTDLARLDRGQADETPLYTAPGLPGVLD